MKECIKVVFTNQLETLWEGILLDNQGYIFSSIINSHIKLLNNKLIIKINDNETIYNLKKLYSTDKSSWYDASLNDEFSNNYTLVCTKELVDDIEYNNHYNMLNKNKVLSKRI
jgi:hypothetical protein